MSEAPQPLTPPECDLQDFAFMPLDVARLRDSSLASDETPEACWAAVLLWATSWHQIPAASIPNNDMWIAKHAGYALRGKVDRAWKGVRDGALRGFIECSDGRLYHPVVAEKAREAWQAKLEQRWRTECARIKKHADRHEMKLDRPTFDEWTKHGCPVGQPLPVPRDKGDCPDDVPGETTSKRQGEGQGQGDSYSVPDGTGGSPPEKSVDDFSRAELWRAGKKVLSDGGMAKDRCGDFVGLLVKDYGENTTIEAVRATVKACPPDPEAYLVATCKALRGERIKVPDRWWTTNDGIEKMGNSLELYWSGNTNPGAFMRYTAHVWLAAGEGPWINETTVSVHNVYKRLKAEADARAAVGVPA